MPIIVVPSEGKLHRGYILISGTPYISLFIFKNA